MSNIAANVVLENALQKGPPEMISEIFSRELALQKLSAFLPEAGPRYAQNRNFDWGSKEMGNTSRLSPAIQRRLLSEEEVLRQTLSSHPFQSCEKFAQEVVWRTYWKGWLEWHPSVWENFQRDLAALKNEPQSEKYRLAIEGATEVKAFDSWRKELAETGYLHNHTRMWFASIWIFTLNLPWQVGAQLFLSELLDADAASNTLSWRWVAGLQTAGKHYVARAENIEKFTAGRFHPVGLLNESPAPIAESSCPKRLAALPRFDMTQLPHCKLGLLVHKEDLSVEETSLRTFSFESIALLRDNSLPISALVASFDEKAIADTNFRLSHAFQKTPIGIEDEIQFQRWCHSLDGVVLVDPWVGPLRDRLTPWLNKVTKPIWLARRAYDLALIPEAARGFFSFRKKLPEWSEQFSRAELSARVQFRRFR
jgi:deoxyribodipyrimidine photo-lyase